MRRRRGFTSFEVMVALAITGVVVAGAHRIFTGVADAARTITVAREELDRRSNARRWLKATFLSLEPPFEGHMDRVEFTSWQLNLAGWLEPHPTELRRTDDRFVGRAGDGTFNLAHGVTDLVFDYLLDPGADSRWVREWVSPVSAPLAVRVRVTGCGRGDAGCVDTLLFLVKERG